MCFYVSTLPSSVCWLRWQANICNWNNENRGGYREEDEQFGAPQAGDEWNKKRWIFVSFLIIFQWRHGIGKIVHFFNEKSVTSQQEDTQKCKKKAFCTRLKLHTHRSQQHSSGPIRQKVQDYVHTGHVWRIQERTKKGSLKPLLA